jgi:hypothetical protein
MPVRIPRSGGRWANPNKEGDCEWLPDLDAMPEKYNYIPPKTWRQILAMEIDWLKTERDAKRLMSDAHRVALINTYTRMQSGKQGVPYIGGKPDMSALSMGTVQIENFSSERQGSEGNFKKAEVKFGEKMGMSANQFAANIMGKHESTLHERIDTKTIDLMSRYIHHNLEHEGGIAEQKRLEAENAKRG